MVWHTPTMSFMSLESAIALTGKSRRTLWRRIQDEAAHRAAKDARGRTLIANDWVRQNTPVPMGDDDWALVLAADRGDANAQSEVGVRFLQAGLHDAAVFWFEQAAEQAQADALHWLSHCHIAGKGVRQSDDMALVYLAKAAAAGHSIASEQMAALKGSLLR